MALKVGRPMVELGRASEGSPPRTAAWVYRTGHTPFGRTQGASEGHREHGNRRGAGSGDGIETATAWSGR